MQMSVSGPSPLFNPPGGGQETRIRFSTPAGRQKAEETLITAMGILAGLVTFVTRAARPWEETFGGLHFKDERHSPRYQRQLLRFSCGAFLGHTTAKSYWGVIIVCPIFEVCVRGPFCFGALQPGGLKSGDFRFRRSCASLGMWACCGIPHKAGHHTHNFRTLHFRAARQVENEN